MTPYIMNRTQVKTYLGISDTSYDAQIATFLPTVSDAVLDFLNRTDLQEISGTIANGSDKITGVSSVDLAVLSVGNIIKGSGFDDGVDAPSILAIDEGAGEIQMSANASTDGTFDFEFCTFPLGGKPIAAQMVLYRILGGSVAGAKKQAGGNKTSERYGPISVSFGGDSEIGTSGFPKSMEKALWSYKRPRFA